MEKVNGELRISVDVVCPKCDEVIDLVQINKFTDDVYIYKEVLEGDELGCKDLNDEVTCPECKYEFLVGEIAW